VSSKNNPIRGFLLLQSCFQVFGFNRKEGIEISDEYGKESELILQILRKGIIKNIRPAMLCLLLQKVAKKHQVA